MIYFIKPIVRSHWLHEFHDNLSAGFEMLGRNNRTISLDEASEVKDAECFILLDHRHINNIELDRLKVVKTTHQHSTACIPTYYQNDFDQEEYYTAREDYVTMANSDFTVKEMNKLLKAHNWIHKVWFPINFNSYERYGGVKDEKLVVMWGRLGSDKQYVLGLQFLKQLVQEGYRCIFSAVDTEESREIYNKKNLKFFEMHGVEIQFNNKDRFYKLLSEANYFVSVSLPETLWLSVVEALIYWCKTYVPYGDNSYSEIICWWYEPYSYNSLLNFIKTDTIFIRSIEWLDYKEVAARYLRVIDDTIIKYNDNLWLIE